MTPFPLRGDRPAWSTAVGLGPIPYRFAGSNPAPRTTFLAHFELECEYSFTILDPL